MHFWIACNIVFLKSLNKKSRTALVKLVDIFFLYIDACGKECVFWIVSEPAVYKWRGHALSPGAARWSSRSDDGGRGCGGGKASDTTRGVCGDSSGFVPASVDLKIN